MERLFERLLWGSRLMVLVAVVASVLAALVTLYMATVDVGRLLVMAVGYGGLSQAKAAEVSLKIVTMVVKTVDGYLLTAVMLIFALGLYELFISRIDLAERSEVAPRLLLIQSLDDLKDRLAKVVVLILVITFFQQAVEMTYQNARDLLFLALGTFLVGGALFLSGKGAHAKAVPGSPAVTGSPGPDAE
jgi:uncharacterized membrane protein YqhA